MAEHRAVTATTAFFAHARKAFASAAVAAVGVAAYLVGVLPDEAGPGDVSFVHWLGALVFVGAAFGITYATPKNRE